MPHIPHKSQCSHTKYTDALTFGIFPFIIRHSACCLDVDNIGTETTAGSALRKAASPEKEVYFGRMYKGKNCPSVCDDDADALSIALPCNLNPRVPCQRCSVRFYNNLQDRGDCQSSRKSYKTSIFVGWVVGWECSL